MEFVMFTKMWKRIGGCSVAETADYLAELGFDGADLTVRDGGHVDPANVRRRLPEAVETFADRGLSVPMITTGITSADDEHAEAIFETADDCGVDHLKFGYWLYDGFDTAREGLEAMRADLDGLAELSRRHDVTPAVHVHSQAYLSAEATLLWDLLRDYDPEVLGAYLDAGHMVVEGTGSGWEIGMDLLAPHAQMVAIKDFGLYPDPGIGDEKATWERRTVPFTDGLVPWPDVFENLEEMAFDGPVSMHGEYHVDDVETLRAQAAEDLEYVRDVLDRIS